MHSITALYQVKFLQIFSQQINDIVCACAQRQRHSYLECHQTIPQMAQTNRKYEEKEDKMKENKKIKNKSFCNVKKKLNKTEITTNVLHFDATQSFGDAKNANKAEEREYFFMSRRQI